MSVCARSPSLARPSQAEILSLKAEIFRLKDDVARADSLREFHKKRADREADLRCHLEHVLKLRSNGKIPKAIEEGASFGQGEEFR
jgi:hypothetical protein